MKKRTSIWTEETKGLVRELHSNLRLDNHNWHALKNNSDRRSAELLISALSQIINEGKKGDIELLIEQSLKWLKKEIKDPGCPNKH